jgi:hypothetical protein
MNNKITIVMLVAVALIAGFLYWQSSRQPAAENSNDQVSSQTASEQTVDKNLVEIFYLPHAPAEAIVQKVEPIVAKHPDYTVKKYDFEDPTNKQKIAQYKMTSHAPIAVFIGGKNSFTIDGKTISLINFPKGDAFIPSFEGEWSYEDLEKILANQQ